MKVRATKKGFGGVPPSRRRVGEVFRVPEPKKGDKPASWYVPVKKDTPEGKPEVERAKVPDYEKVDGSIVPVDRRSVSGQGQPDTGYLDKFADASPDVPGEESLI